MTGKSPARIRHLRPRGDGLDQPITTVELFFDLVYVFAVAQSSHMILDDLTVAQLGRAAFLAADRVAGVDLHHLDRQLVRPGIAGGARGAHGCHARQPPHRGRAAGRVRQRRDAVRGRYVTLQVGRNVSAASLLGRDQPLREVFERLVGWSAASGVLWLAGTALAGDRRLLLWIPAVGLDLCAPYAGYWLRAGATP